MRALRTVVFVIGFLAMTWVVTTASAATPGGAGASSTPATSTVGAASLIPAPNIQNGQAPLLFEEFSDEDYTVPYTATADNGILTPVVDAINYEFSQIAGAFVLTFTICGLLAVRILEWAFTVNLMTDLGDELDQLVGSLRQSLYVPFVAGTLLIATVACAWMFFASRRFLQPILGILWAGFALFLAAVFFAAPSTYIDQGADLSNQISQSIMGTAAQDSSSFIAGDRANQLSGDAQTDEELREFDNRLWYEFVFVPYTVIALGEPDPTVNGHDLGVELLQKNAGQASDYDTDIKAAPQPVQQWAAGQDSLGRFVIGGLLMLMALVGLLCVLGSAIAVFLASLRVMLAVVIAPLVMILWPIPGYGMRLAERWVGTVIAALAIKVLATLYLVVTLTMLAALSTLSTTLGLALVAILQIVTMIALFHFRKIFFRTGHAAMASVPFMHHRITQDTAQRHVQEHSAAHAIESGAAGGAAAELTYQGLHGLQRGIANRTATHLATSAAPKLATKTIANGAATTAASTGATVATGGAALVGIAALEAGKRGVQAYQRGMGAVQSHAASHILGVDEPGGRVSSGAGTGAGPAAVAGGMWKTIAKAPTPRSASGTRQKAPVPSSGNPKLSTRSVAPQRDGSGRFATEEQVAAWRERSARNRALDVAQAERYGRQVPLEYNK